MLIAVTHDKSISHRSEKSTRVADTYNFDLEGHFKVILDHKGPISKSSKYSHVIYQKIGIEKTNSLVLFLIMLEWI